MLHGVAPELQAIAPAPPGGPHQVEAEEAVGGVVAHAGDAADRLTAQPAHPDALAIGVAVDGHIAAARGKALLAGPGGDDGDIAPLQRLNAQEGGHGLRMARQAVEEAITADEVTLLAQDLGYTVSGSDILRFSGQSADVA